MRVMQLKEIFKKADLEIKHLWELSFTNSEVIDFNNEQQKLHLGKDSEKLIPEMSQGYFVITDLGHYEVRYGQVSISIRRVTDFGFDTPVLLDVILPSVNQLDTSIILSTLRQYIKNNFKR